MKRFRVLCLCVLVLSGIACLPPGISEDRPVYIDAEVVYRGTQCNGPVKGPSAEWVLDAGHLSVIYSRLHRHIISPKVTSPPEIDFSGSVLLLIDMGQVPSSGYGIDLAERAVSVAGGTAVLRVFWTEPGPESVQAQILTSPCIMVRLPISGYTSARVLDQHGTTLIKLEINPK